MVKKKKLFNLKVKYEHEPVFKGTFENMEEMEKAFKKLRGKFK